MTDQQSPDDPIALLSAAGVFDAAWFDRRNPDVRTKGHDPLTHFHLYGWREGRWPNAYFDPGDYRRRYPDVRASDEDPLLHYVQYGEREGRRPVVHFDPVWYRAANQVPPDDLCLAHFLARRTTGTVSPVAEFDAAYYLRISPDVAEAGMDPFEHYLVQGAREGRRPAADFDPAYYREHYLSGTDANPLLHFLQHRDQAQVQKQRPATTDIPREVRRFTRPGPLFEEFRPLAPGVPIRAKLLAYYLPQYHPVAENDAAWGRGFTEWTNVGRGLPRFAGHYQPRTPRDLGHYRLEGTATLRRQAAMARHAGVHGFVFYYYRFGARRVLDAPLEALLDDASLELPFCLMWANENWTRRWDGSAHDVLIAQDHRVEDEPGLVSDLVRHMRDPRYIRVGGRALLMVYRMDIVPDGAVARWRRLFAALGEQPFFVMAQTFGQTDPRPFGMDAAVEFPPHKLGDRLDPVVGLSALDPGMTTRVYAYEAMVQASLNEPAPDFPLIRTAVPDWDNDARQPGAGMALHGASPQRYAAWLDALIRFAGRHKLMDDTIVCVNAWNEWAEGAYLEPDQYFGSAYLNATARVMAGMAQTAADGRLLLVGHDAFPAGAQLLLLALGRQLRRAHGLDVSFLLLKGGALLGAFQDVAPTIVSADPVAELRAAATRGLRAAIVNTAAAACMVPLLAEANIQSVLLIHELPQTLRRRGLEDDLRQAVASARRAVFPADYVRDRIQGLVPLDRARSTVLPQGVYAPARAGPGGAAQLRDRLRLPPGASLAVGMGQGDLRKGFDLFLQVWRYLQTGRQRIHLLWVGDLDPDLAHSLGAEIAGAEASGTFHHLPFEPHASDWFGAADALLLTSREDPLPSVVLEAMSAGTPTVAFEDSGGIPDLLRQHHAGTSVPLGDAPAMARALRRLLGMWGAGERSRLTEVARDRFGFGAYATALARLAIPDMHDISVVVLSCDYARYLPERLHSVFAQSYPVREVIVLDDASADDSAEVARRTALAAERDLVVDVSDARAGVFAQWRRAAERACGEWLWIAEADDACEPGFLEALAGKLGAGIALAFTDSRSIDATGRPTDINYYKRYYGPGRLAHDEIWDGPAFVSAHLAERNLIVNASAVVWRRAALLAALDRCGPELDRLCLAGDWRLYVEVLLAPGARVAYVAQPLNVHRRHEASVTQTVPRVRHLDEIASLHRVLASRLREPGLRKRQKAYRMDVQAQLAARP